MDGGYDYDWCEVLWDGENVSIGGPWRIDVPRMLRLINEELDFRFNKSFPQWQSWGWNFVVPPEQGLTSKKQVYMPSERQLEDLSRYVDVQHTDNNKSGAVDMYIVSRISGLITEAMRTSRDPAENHTAVLLIAGDYDYSASVDKLRDVGFDVYVVSTSTRSRAWQSQGPLAPGKGSLYVYPDDIYQEVLQHVMLVKKRDVLACIRMPEVIFNYYEKYPELLDRDFPVEEGVAERSFEDTELVIRAAVKMVGRPELRKYMLDALDTMAGFREVTGVRPTDPAGPSLDELALAAEEQLGDRMRYAVQTRGWLTRPGAYAKFGFLQYRFGEDSIMMKKHIDKLAEYLGVRLWNGKHWVDNSLMSPSVRYTQIMFDSDTAPTTEPFLRKMLEWRSGEVRVVLNPPARDMSQFSSRKIIYAEVLVVFHSKDQQTEEEVAAALEATGGLVTGVPEYRLASSRADTRPSTSRAASSIDNATPVAVADEPPAPPGLYRRPTEPEGTVARIAHPTATTAQLHIAKRLMESMRLPAVKGIEVHDGVIYVHCDSLVLLTQLTSMMNAFLDVAVDNYRS